MADTEIEGLLRTLAPQVLGAVVRRYGHFDTAEDAVQEALLAAALQWPKDGVPDNARGWLITVASRRLTDLLRNEQARPRRERAVAHWVLPDGRASGRALSRSHCLWALRAPNGSARSCTCST
jgi:predicted RNA polymerase sigma factor